MTLAIDELSDADLDALAARLTQRWADQPLVNMAGLAVTPLATTGRIQVSPGQTIASTWGNTLWDQSVNKFASAADRDTQWTAPPDGAMCYTADTQTVWLRKNGVWTPPLITGLFGPSMVGTYAGQSLILRIGRGSGTTSSAGAFAAPFNFTFPGGVQAVIPSSTAMGAPTVMVGTNPPNTASQVTLQFWTPAGVAAASMAIGYSLIVVGW